VQTSITLLTIKRFTVLFIVYSRWSISALA
jgi:hypothetical protein